MTKDRSTGSLLSSEGQPSKSFSQVAALHLNHQFSSNRDSGNNQRYESTINETASSNESKILKAQLSIKEEQVLELQKWVTYLAETL